MTTPDNSNARSKTERPPTGALLDFSNPALRGAARAFQPTPPPARPLVNTYSGINGALAAATKAGLKAQQPGQKATAGERYTPLTEVAATRSPSITTRNTTTGSVSVPEYDPPTAQSSRQKSPSHIAANRAAARQTPLRRDGTTQGFQLTSSTVKQSNVPQEVIKDESPIPPTTSLVKLFEQKQLEQEAKPALVPKALIKRPVEPVVRAIVSPQPIRPIVPLRLSSQTSIAGSKPRWVKEQQAAQQRTDNVGSAQEKRIISPPSKRQMNALNTSSAKLPPAVPVPRRKAQPLTMDLTLQSNLNLPARRNEQEQPFSSPPENALRGGPASARQAVSSPSTLIRPSSARPTKPGSPPFQSTSYSSLPSRPASARPQRATPLRAITPQMTADSLANAMVASSLASSRATTPSVSLLGHQPALPRRQSKPHSLSALTLAIFHNPPQLSRTPSPSKESGRMRQTLRAQPTSFEEENLQKKRGHGRLVRKHPNKHREGDRKRWRDSITEQERKRYEGVWAANRGLLIEDAPRAQDYGHSQTQLLEEVHGLVVKDIWSRSSLSPAVLAEIWDLVVGLGRSSSAPRSAENLAGSSLTQLSREEFVVGMWLVDQCLKGRKLPTMVGATVWESVRWLSGVTLGKSRGRGS